MNLIMTGGSVCGFLLRAICGKSHLTLNWTIPRLSDVGVHVLHPRGKVSDTNSIHQWIRTRIGLKKNSVPFAQFIKTQF